MAAYINNISRFSEKQNSVIMAAWPRVSTAALGIYLARQQHINGGISVKSNAIATAA